MKKKINQTFLSCALLLLLGLIWGTGYSIARFAMTHDVTPLGYSFWQAIGPAFLISILAYLTRTRPVIASAAKQSPYDTLDCHVAKNASRNDERNSRDTSCHPHESENLRDTSCHPRESGDPFNCKFNIKFYLICGLTGIVIPNTVMYFAAAHLPASLLAMIVNIVPIVSYPMALAMKSEYFHWQRMMGIVLASIGLVLIITPQSDLSYAHFAPTILFTLLTPISFAFCSIYIAKYRPINTTIMTTTALMLIAASVLLTPFVIFTHSFYSLHYPLTLPDKIIILEIGLSSLGYLLFFQLIKIAGAVFYSLVDTVVVLTGILWGYVIFGEQLNQWTSSALIFILLGMILVTQLQPIIMNEQTNDKGL